MKLLEERVFVFRRRSSRRRGRTIEEVEKRKGKREEKGGERRGRSRSGRRRRYVIHTLLAREDVSLPTILHAVFTLEKCLLC